jgi:hypothetical protein
LEYLFPQKRVKCEQIIVELYIAVHIYNNLKVSSLSPKTRTVEFSLLFKDGYANAMGMSYDSVREFSFSIDPAGQAFVPPTVADFVYAGRVVGDGNCFFRALSLRLFGTQVMC